MSNDEIKELIQLVVESGIAELELQRGEDRVRIRRTWEPKPEFAVPAAAQASTPAVTLAAAPAAAEANEHIVKSPIVGTYYESPKPGDPAFVKVGDSVEPGQVL